MASSKPEDRLQPSLLDRLTDHEPHDREKARERWVLTLPQLRDAVKRDLAWLLNTGNIHGLQSLDEHPYVARSVVNYGVPDVTGRVASNVDIPLVEKTLRQAILDFEPRILAKTLRVRVTVQTREMTHNALRFDIEGELWAQPVPMRLVLKSEMDLESGHVLIEDAAGGR